MKSGLRLPLLHPLLLSQAPILFLLAHNAQEASLADAWRPSIVAAIFSVILLVTSRAVTRSWERAALLASPAILLLFSYGHLYRLVKPLTLSGVPLGRHRYLLPLLVVALGVWYLFLRRRHRPVVPFTEFANLLGVLTVVVPLVSLSLYGLRTSPASESSVETTLIGGQAVVTDQGQPPDIYYIILDSYPRGDVLEEYYGYDNSGFLTALEARGFYVASDSYSNYKHSIQSIASSLNMTYLHELGADLRYPQDHEDLAELIQHSEVRRQLEARAYSIYALTSSYPPTEITDADFYLVPNMARVQALEAQGAFSDFEILLMRQSIAKALLDLEGRSRNVVGEFIQERVENAKSIRREVVVSAFRNLRDLGDVPGPKFVFAHIVSPHFPYLFDAEGKPIRTEDLDPEAEGTVPADSVSWEYFRDQLEYVNSEVLAIVDEIQAESKVPPVILIQADHGPDTYYLRDGFSASGEVRRVAILNAYALPDTCASELYPAISPVNSYRLVFNCLFGGNLDLLPDRSYRVDNRSGEVEVIPLEGIEVK